METTTKKPIKSIISIIVIIVLVIVGVKWYTAQTQTPEKITAKKAAVFAKYVGVYTFQESSTDTIKHTLTLSPEADKLNAILDVDGKQLTGRFTGHGVIGKLGLDIIFDSYREGNSVAPFLKGDVLFTLKKENNNDFKIMWDKMKPFLQTTNANNSVYTQIGG
jgi:hypothetical protein